MTDNRKLRAYYSAKMAEISGTSFYKREDGTEVECTCVAETPSNLKWDDVEDRGPVVSWSRGRLKFRTPAF